MVLPAKAAGASSAHYLWHRRKRRHLQPQRAGGLEWAAQACKETMLPFLKETWVFPSPAYPTSPSPDPLPLLLSRSVVFRTILSGNDAKCCPQANLQPPALVVFPVCGSLVCLYFGGVPIMGQLWALWSRNGFVCLFGGLFPCVPLLPSSLLTAAQPWVGCLEEEWGSHCKHRKAACGTCVSHNAGYHQKNHQLF